MLKDTLKSRFPHFWEILWAEKKVPLQILILLAPISLSASVIFSVFYFHSWVAPFQVVKESWLVITLAFCSFVLFLSELISSYRRIFKNWKTGFLNRFLEKLEATYSGIYSDQKSADEISNSLNHLVWSFSYLSILVVWFLLLFFLLGSFLGFFFLNGYQNAAMRAMGLVIGSLAIFGIPIFLKYFQFKKSMEQFQAAFRNLLVDYDWKEKHHFAPPSGSFDLDLLKTKEGQHSYLRFFELSHTKWGRPVFRNFSLTFPAQKSIGICAKEPGSLQCFFELVSRKVDPESGLLRLYNKDLREYSRGSFNEHFRIVGSIDFFFHGTVRENVLIHQPNTNIENQKIYAVLEKCDLSHLVSSKISGVDKSLSKNISNLDKFRLRLARAILLPQAKCFYLLNPFLGLSTSEIRLATKLLGRIAKDYEIFFYECFEEASAEESELLLLFRDGKNPVLSNFSNLLQIQPELTVWKNSSRGRVPLRRILVDFRLENGSEKQFSWYLDKNPLANIWWINLWKSFSQGPTGTEQRFFGWRTEEKHQKSRVQALNRAIEIINNHFGDKYQISTHAYFGMNQDRLNEIHHHFEILMGQSWNPSEYLKGLPITVHNAIRALNDIVHDYEYAMRTISPPKGFHVVSGFQFRALPAEQNPIPKECFPIFSYENQSGDIVTDYCQLGKTWSEVFDDGDTHIYKENISPLRYFSSSFICNFHNLPADEAAARKKNIQDFIRKKNQENGWDFSADAPENALGHILLARLEPLGTNYPPTLKEFSGYSSILKIKLEQDGKSLSISPVKTPEAYE
jgi:hypothetical protein